MKENWIIIENYQTLFSDLEIFWSNWEKIRVFALVQGPWGTQKKSLKPWKFEQIISKRLGDMAVEILPFPNMVTWKWNVYLLIKNPR